MRAMYNFKKTCLLLSLILSQSVSILAIIDTTAPGLTDPQVLSGAIKINALSREAKSNDNALALEISNAAANVIEDQAQALATSKKESEFDQKTIFDIQEQIDKQDAQIASNDAEKAELQNSLNQSESELNSSFNQDFANQQVAGTEVSNSSLSMAVVFPVVIVGLIAGIIALWKKSQKDAENTAPRVSEDINNFKYLVDRLNDGKFLADEASVRRIVDIHEFLKSNTINLSDSAIILDEVSDIISKKLKVSPDDEASKVKFEDLKAEISKLRARRSSTWDVTIDSNKIDLLKTRIRDSVPGGRDYSKELKAAEEQRAAAVTRTTKSNSFRETDRPSGTTFTERPLRQELSDAEIQQNSTETQATRQKSKNDILLETIQKAKQFVADKSATKSKYQVNDPDVLVAIFKAQMDVNEKFNDFVDPKILKKYLQNALIDKVLPNNSTLESLAQKFETEIIEERVKQLKSEIEQRGKATSSLLGNTDNATMSRQVPEIISRVSEVSGLNTILERVKARNPPQTHGAEAPTPAPLAPVSVTPAAATLNPTEEANGEPKTSTNDLEAQAAYSDQLEPKPASAETTEDNKEAAKIISEKVDIERQKKEAAATKIQALARGRQGRAEVTKKTAERLAVATKGHRP